MPAALPCSPVHSCELLSVVSSQLRLTLPQLLDVLALHLPLSSLGAAGDPSLLDLMLRKRLSPV